jgi:hypothetical protein
MDTTETTELIMDFDERMAELEAEIIASKAFLSSLSAGDEDLF